VAAAGDANKVDELKAVKDLGGTNYKVHLDGYDQMDLLTGEGTSKRHEIWYCAESNLGGLLLDDFKYGLIDQPEGWPGLKVSVNMPFLENNKQDPFERLSVSNLLEGSPAYFNDFYAREFWRFVYVQQRVGDLARSQRSPGRYRRKNH
jgi:arylsulfatase